MQAWYALYTKPCMEGLVETYLNRLHIESFFPVVPAPRRKNRPATRAFFPCYLFAHADLEQVGLWPLQYAAGVRHVVMKGDLPARIDDHLITLLRLRLARTELVDGNGMTLEPGDAVRITSGPFAEMSAVFDRQLSSAGRVRILLNWLQRGTPVEIDAAVLRKVPGNPQRERIASGIS
jgi:transcription antitermination factor NusG